MQSKKLDEMTDREIEQVLQAINIMKLQKTGRESNRFKKEQDACGRCLTKHPQNRSPAWGHICQNCGGKGLFDPACKQKKPASIRRVTDVGNSAYFTSGRSDCPDMEDETTAPSPTTAESNQKGK